MKTVYVSPEMEIICFAADEKLASEWDTYTGKLFGSNAGTLDGASAVDFTIPETDNPEGNF